MTHQGRIVAEDAWSRQEANTVPTQGRHHLAGRERIGPPIRNNLDSENTSLLHSEESAPRKSERPVVPFTGKEGYPLNAEKKKKSLFHPERKII